MIVDGGPVEVRCGANFLSAHGSSPPWGAFVRGVRVGRF